MNYKNLPKRLQETIKEADYQEPQINIEKEVHVYVDGVIKNPDDEQEHLVKKFVESKVNLTLHSWKSRYRQNDEIIENIEARIKSNEEDIAELESEKKDLNKKVKKIKSTKHENEEYIEDIERVAPSSDINKKSTLIFLIIVALGLAILTAYKFSTAMNAISVELDDQSLGIVQYIIYGLGSLAILATGKILNVVYEKINYSKTFFLSVSATAIVLAAFTAYFLAGDKAFLNTKQVATTGMEKIENDIESIDKKLKKKIENCLGQNKTIKQQAV